MKRQAKIERQRKSDKITERQIDRQTDKQKQTKRQTNKKERHVDRITDYKQQDTTDTIDRKIQNHIIEIVSTNQSTIKEIKFYLEVNVDALFFILIVKPYRSDRSTIRKV